MSKLRYDPAHRPRTVGTGHSRRRIPGEGPRSVEDDARMARRRAREARSFLSVVVPARNEVAGLPQLIDEIARALRPLRDGGSRPGRSRDRERAVGPGSEALPLPDRRGSWRRLAGFEILIVDDGSTDRTPEVLGSLAADYPELRGIVLADGVGQASATVAGIRAARGDWIATLDADLQNDPADLVRLWEALPGHDVALGWRVDRRDVWSRRVISRWANRMRNAVLGQSIRDTGCSVRIFPREVALRLPAFRGVHRFLGPLLLREGCRLVQVPVGHRPRPHGRSHYHLWNRSLQVIVDLIGVAWLLRRPLEYRVLRAWDAADTAGVALAGAAGGKARPGAED
jgi:glycosyltransferase involved in cell wall biosynthesis